MLFGIKNENFLEFLRNLTPQTILLAVSISGFIRINNNGFNWSDFSLFLGFFIIFIWAAGANYFALVENIKCNLLDKNKGKPGIKKVLIPVLLATALLYAGMGVVSYTAITTALMRTPQVVTEQTTSQPTPTRQVDKVKSSTP